MSYTYDYLGHPTVAKMWITSPLFGGEIVYVDATDCLEAALQLTRCCRRGTHIQLYVPGELDLGWECRSSGQYDPACMTEDEVAAYEARDS